MSTPLPPPRLLTNLTTDPSHFSSSNNHHHHDDNGSGSGSDEGGGSTPATPSKDKMREWTFPRSSGAAGGGATSSSSSSRTARTIDVSAAHGRSSSIAPSASPSSATKSPSTSHSADPARRPLLQHAASSSSNASRDFRHRTNASLAFAASATPEIGSSPRGGFSQLPSSASPTYSALPPSSTSTSPSAPSSTPTPSGTLKMVYSNLRRRSLNDLLYLLIFSSAFILFSSALLGVGYDGAGPTSSSYPASSPRAVGTYQPPGEGRGEVLEDVKIPPTFLRPEDLREGDVPADVHQPFGVVAEEEEEHFKETPGEWEGVVGDEEVHSHPDPALRPPHDPALFPDPDASSSSPSDEHYHASEDALLAEHEGRERRPRPARLDRIAVVEAEEAGEGVEEEEDGEEEEDIDLSPDAVESSGQDDETADYPSDEDEEDEEEPLVDDSIDVSNPAIHSDGSLHLADDDVGEGEDELSALEELLDAGLAEAEEEEGVVGEREEREEREELERLERGRVEARRPPVPVGGAGAGAGVDGEEEQGVGMKRMVRRLR